MIGITMLKIMRGHDTEVYRFLKDMKYVKEVYHVLGEFPLFVIIQAEDQFTLNRLIDTIKARQNLDLKLWLDHSTQLIHCNCPGCRVHCLYYTRLQLIEDQVLAPFHKP